MLPNKLYIGQKFYDPVNHQKPTVKLLAYHDKYYMVREKGQEVPFILSVQAFRSLYQGYELMPRMRNHKFIK